jgi:hypothetical protein
MTQIRLALDDPTWDRPIRPRMPRGHERITPASGRVPTVEEAISAWIAARGFAPSTGAAARQHLESGRARGWRSRRGIATIDQLSAETACAYVVYLRDRGAAPATLRKVRTLLSSLAAFCAETPGYEAGLQGDQLAHLR